jgi:hypothetical protein
MTDCAMKGLISLAKYRFIINNFDIVVGCDLHVQSVDKRDRKTEVRYSKFKKLLDCQNYILNKMLVLTVLGYKKISLECTHVKI